MELNCRVETGVAIANIVWFAASFTGHSLSPAVHQQMCVQGRSAPYRLEQRLGRDQVRALVCTTIDASRELDASRERLTGLDSATLDLAELRQDQQLADRDRSIKNATTQQRVPAIRRRR